MKIDFATRKIYLIQKENLKNQSLQMRTFNNLMIVSE